MADDFEIEPGLTIGQAIHDAIVEIHVVETDGWAAERAARVAGRLQRGVPEADQLRVLIPWIDAFIAFTAPGRYIYFARRLYERCPDDETTAFVIAHELAHHQLGHLRVFPAWLTRLSRRVGGGKLLGLWPALERRLYGPERECDADRRALELCLAAGYDGERCLRWFEIMTMICLDLGDRAIVFGPDPESDQELASSASFGTKARIWAWQRLRGYLPLTDREAVLRAHLAKLKARTQGSPHGT